MVAVKRRVLHLSFTNLEAVKMSRYKSSTVPFMDVPVFMFLTKDQIHTIRQFIYDLWVNVVRMKNANTRISAVAIKLDLSTMPMYDFHAQCPHIIDSLSEMYNALNDEKEGINRILWSEAFNFTNYVDDLHRELSVSSEFNTLISCAADCPDYTAVDRAIIRDLIEDRPFYNYVVPADVQPLYEQFINLVISMEKSYGRKTDGSIPNT